MHKITGRIEDEKWNVEQIQWLVELLDLASRQALQPVEYGDRIACTIATASGMYSTGGSGA